MARTFLTAVDLSNNSLLNGRIDARWAATPSGATNPNGTGTAVQGQLSSYNGVIYVFDGSSWVALSSTVGTVTSVTGTAPIASSGGATPAISIAAASTSGSGAVQLSDSISSTSTSLAATANAAKTAYDRGSQGITDAAAAATTANNALPKAGGTMTGFITTHADPTTDLHVANKRYVDGVAQGLDIKGSVRVATTAQLTLVTVGTAVDGVTLIAGDRVLVKNQTTASENGIYVAGAGNWARAADADTAAKLHDGAFVFVEQGTQAGTGWVLTTDNPITIGTTALTFTQFSAASSAIAGNGLTATNNVFNVVGTANRIVSNADSIDIASTYVGQNTITTLGTVTTGTWNGSVIAGQYGGTGVNNSGKTITLGGNLTTSGAHTTTLTTTGNTTVTLPTTGTLLTSTTGVTTVNGSSGAITNVAKKATGSITLVANTAQAFTHNLGSQSVLVQVFTNPGWEMVEMDHTNTTTNTTTLTSSVAGTYNWVAIG
jgi:hypothetical protein